VTEHRRSERSGVPWWTPLLGLALLVAAVVTGIATRHDGAWPAVAAAPAQQVLGAQKTVARGRTASPLTAARAALLPVPSTGLVALAGRHARARRVPVREVVGPDIFWVGTSRGERLLVHLQGGGATHRIRPGQRLDFTGVVARNPAGAAGSWGLTPAEGARQFVRQGAHLEVYAPRIRFTCFDRC
jgi:hypothetical protein